MYHDLYITDARCICELCQGITVVEQEDFYNGIHSLRKYSEREREGENGYRCFHASRRLFRNRRDNAVLQLHRRNAKKCGKKSIAFSGAICYNRHSATRATMDCKHDCIILICICEIIAFKFNLITQQNTCFAKIICK